MRKNAYFKGFFNQVPVFKKYNFIVKYPFFKSPECQVTTCKISHICYNVIVVKYYKKENKKMKTIKNQNTINYYLSLYDKSNNTELWQVYKTCSDQTSTLAHTNKILT